MIINQRLCQENWKKTDRRPFSPFLALFRHRFCECTSPIQSELYILAVLRLKDSSIFINQHFCQENSRKPDRRFFNMTAPLAPKFFVIFFFFFLVSPTQEVTTMSFHHRKCYNKFWEPTTLHKRVVSCSVWRHPWHAPALSCLLLSTYYYYRRCHHFQFLRFPSSICLSPFFSKNKKVISKTSMTSKFVDSNNNNSRRLFQAIRDLSYNCKLYVFLSKFK